MSAKDFEFETLLLVSNKFCGRDIFGIWRAELEQIADETGGNIVFFGTDLEARNALDGEGLIFAASESHLTNHVTTHSVFRYAPPSYLRITLQHGFECIGFRHSGDHVRAHGSTASFGADIVCAWQKSSWLASMAASQRPKLFVTGPSAVLQQPTGQCDRPKNPIGIVCENLHSVRLNSAGDFKGEFVESFSDFCELLNRDGRRVNLRPHPGGQYVLKNGVAVPKNAEIDNAPMYRTDLRKYAYGISAPSSVLIDMLLANIPTAVWCDASGAMDTRNYDGLMFVSSPAEWLDFSRAAIEEPRPFLEAQARFLADQHMPLDPQEVFYRYAELFYAARRMNVRPAGFSPERERILFVANSDVPTLQLSFEKPLATLVACGAITTDLLTEPEVIAALNVDSPGSLEGILDNFDPSSIVFCRYSGPGYERIVEWACANNVPLTYHVDDDLLAIPPDIGQSKFDHHNHPDRINSVRFLLNNSDLVYASTDRLRSKLLEYFPNLAIVAGKIYCSGTIIRGTGVGPATKFGYMASADHAHNLDMVLPAIVRILEANADVQFELFGSIPVPSELTKFGDRIITAPPIRNYSAFLETFAARGWDIGICPLAPIEFNMMKANTKWVEYTSAGVAVIASRGTVYDECCADGCGILASSEDEWFEALSTLLVKDEYRQEIVERAQMKLRDEYSISKLLDQVQEVIRKARENRSLSNMGTKKEQSCQTA